MNYSISKTNFIYYCCCSIILIPKINLITFPNQTHGIRIDDILIILCFILIINNIKISKLPNNYWYILFYFYIFTYALIGTLVYYEISAIIVAIKWLEYSLFYIIITHQEIKKSYFRRFIYLFIFLNFFAVILQYNNMMGGFYSTGYTFDLMLRYPGLTGGSWELPFMLAVFTLSLYYDPKFWNNKFLVILITLISFSMVYLSGTRTGLVVFISGLLITLIEKYKINLSIVFKPKILVIVCSSISVLSYIGFSNPRIVEMYRYATEGDLNSAFYSVSVRLKNWSRIYENFEKEYYVFGGGPGFTEFYVDSMYVKIFFDYGIFGLFIFFTFYLSIINKLSLKFVFLLYCITIDAITASKLMFSLYFVINYIKVINIYEYNNRWVKYYSWWGISTSTKSSPTL